jgi:ABC-type nitrate/sulfonate/bicarbonate transport system substrate-binding protein
VTALVLALTVIGCGRTEEPSPTRPTVVSIRLKWLHQAQFAGFYAAAAKGYYRQHNLEVRLDPGGVDFPAVAMVAGGTNDFGVTGADQVLLAREKGAPVVAVAVIYRKSPFCYFSLKSSGVSRLQDFVGRRVGVKLGGNEELTYRAMVAKASVKPNAIIEVPVKYDMTPLFTGDVVAWPGYSINEPLVAQEQGHEVTYIWPSDYGVSLYADTLFTTERMIREHPDIVRGVVAATVEGWKFALAHDEAVDYVIKQDAGLKRAHELAMLHASRDLVRPDDKPLGHMDEAKWIELQDMLLQYGFMKQRVPISSAFTTRFLPPVR